MELRGELLNKNFHFYFSKKWQFLFESFSRTSSLLEIDIQSTKDIRKDYNWREKLFCIIILFQQFLKQKSYEAKYNVDLVKDAQSGQTKFVQREKDELDEHVDNLKAKKLAKKGIIVKSKEEKRKEKRLKEKEKRMKKKRKSFKQMQLKEEFDDTPEQLGTI